MSAGSVGWSCMELTLVAGGRSGFRPRRTATQPRAPRAPAGPYFSSVSLIASRYALAAARKAASGSTPSDSARAARARSS
ncbi:hypothetical protein GCM10014715_25140 [Streptomyces spiralis]|uniref:Uncharacterized protein n=1 Tax=Streptomyces spiralis TaxID=66376 RepID=A0A918ZVG0_9ACTN|nr:hypothetical protein GCM10014715_25140 [Streptomyces spiralis]